MKLFILFCLLFVSIVNGQLRCFHCENQPTLEACLRNGRINTCQPNEDACQTEVRRRNSDALYFKRCKQSLACMNNEIQNLRAAATPTQCNVQGEGSVCRCCCFTNECGRQENCTDRTPFDDPLPTVEPIPTESVPEDRCRELPEWDEGQVLCPPDENEEGWAIGDTCQYKCPDGRIVIGHNTTVCTRRLNEETGQSELGFFPRPPCCGAPINCVSKRPADIVFVLDSSTSIGFENWDRIIRFVLRVSEPLIVSPEQTRIGIITYGFEVYTNWELRLDAYQNEREFEAAVLATPYINTRFGTATASALTYAAETAFTPGFGSRANAEHLIIFVTDGMTTLGEGPKLPDAARALHEVATRVYAVGIGIEDRTELDIIATTPDDVSLIGFNELSGMDISNLILGFVCDYRCSQTPNTPEERCRIPPIWEEGDVICPAQTGNGWLLGDVCEFRCLPGYIRKGVASATCSRLTNPLNGETELQFSPEEGPCCDTPCSSMVVADIVFVLDSSTSIGSGNWDRIIRFVNQLARTVPVGPRRVQFAVITYGHRVYMEDHIPFQSSLRVFQNRLNRLRYRSERFGTLTASALAFTAEYAFTRSFGARPNVENRLVIFVTDGMTSRSEVSDLPGAIDFLHEVATKVYAVGIAVQNPGELFEIASSPEQVSQINSFNQLNGETLVDDIRNFVCNSRCRR